MTRFKFVSRRTLWSFTMLYLKQLDTESTRLRKRTSIIWTSYSEDMPNEYCTIIYYKFYEMLGCE